MIRKKDECTCNQHPDYEACCETFKAFLNDCKVGLKYHKEDREFSILIARDMGRQGIFNCPWCGTKLPESLQDLREGILWKEHGINNPYDKKQSKLVPAEFLTDEWWKNRGL